MATKVGEGQTSECVVQRTKKKRKSGAFNLSSTSEKSNKMRTQINIRLSNMEVIHDLGKSSFGGTVRDKA